MPGTINKRCRQEGTIIVAISFRKGNSSGTAEAMTFIMIGCTTFLLRTKRPFSGLLPVDKGHWVIAG